MQSSQVEQRVLQSHVDNPLLHLFRAPTDSCCLCLQRHAMLRCLTVRHVTLTCDTAVSFWPPYYLTLLLLRFAATVTALSSSPVVRHVALSPKHRQRAAAACPAPTPFALRSAQAAAQAAGAGLGRSGKQATAMLASQSVQPA